MFEGEGCTGGIPAHQQHRSFLYGSSSRPSKPQHLVSKRASIGCLCLAFFFVQFLLRLKKAKCPPELAGKHCSPGDSDEPGRAAAPPGAAISLPWWMLQPPAVSQRQEQHWTACLQMIHFSTRTRFRYDGDLWSVYWSTVLRLLDFILPFLVSEPLVCRLL